MTNKMCVVKNRSASMVVYRIPEDNIRREFAPGEVKTLPYEELGKLAYQSGGREIMANFLQIKEKEVRENLSIRTELEYDMSEEDIVNLILTGSQDSFLDALDFAPPGVIDLIKTYAVKLPMNDTEKRKALKEKTGFDVSTVLMNLEKEREEENETPSAPTRRVQPKETGAPERRVVVKKAVSEETEKND